MRPDLVSGFPRSSAHAAAAIRRYRLHTGQLEGMHNKTKSKRQAYGFRDHDYFILRSKRHFQVACTQIRDEPTMG
jgi:transposase